jgi:hypothetical protein
VFAFLLANFLISYVNEQMQPRNERNSIWDLLLSLFPANGQMWPNQFGLTRKVLLATSGFGILILSSLYQAKQAEVLMIPVPPPVFTLRDIENAVSSHSAKLMVNSESSPHLNYIKSMSESLTKSLKSNPAMFASNWNSKLDAINSESGIYVYSESYLLYLLAEIEPDLCENYLYIPLEEWTRIYTALIMRKGRVDTLERMNVIVAERMSYVDDFIQSSQLNEECRKHIFPVYTPDPKYDALKLVELSGTFLFLFIFLCLSLFIFLFELAYVWWRPKLKTFRMTISFKCTLAPEHQDFIIAKYLKITELIANDK